MEHITFTSAKHAKSFHLYKNTHILPVCICWSNTQIWILLECNYVEHSKDSATFTTVMQMFSNISTVTTYAQFFLLPKRQRPVRHANDPVLQPQFHAFNFRTNLTWSQTFYSWFGQHHSRLSVQAQLDKKKGRQAYRQGQESELSELPV